jgi:hypothetical protein
LTAKHFESGSPQKNGRYVHTEDSSDGSCSPIKAFGKLKLESIDETDSFCTDSSYQPSEDLYTKKRKNAANDEEISPLGRINFNLYKGDDISEEEDDEDLENHHHLGKNLYGNKECGSPIKRALLYPKQTINQIILKAKKEAKENVMKTLSMTEPPKSIIKLKEIGPNTI